MPKLLCCFLVVLLCICSVQGQDMVPTPTFEINPLLSPPPCPYGQSVASMYRDNVKSCLMNPGNVVTWSAVLNGVDPDYFNTCVTATPCTETNEAAWADVPNTYFGYQQALSGNGFVGLAFDFGSVDNLPSTNPAKMWYVHKSEYITAQLLASMKKGNSYVVKFHVSLSPFSNAYALRDFGAYFSTNSVATNTALTYIPQVHNGMTGLNYDQTNWTPISGNFIAQGNYNYITIGLFKTTDTVSIGLRNPQSVCWANVAAHYQGEFGDLVYKLPYYFVDTDGLNPMVQECSCDSSLDIILVPIDSVDDGDDCCYKIKLKNTSECTQEIIGLRVRDLGYRFAGAGDEELKVVSDIMQSGDDVGFFVNETYNNNVQSGLLLQPNEEKILGTICLTPGTSINGKFILLRNENIGGIYAEKCEKVKPFEECTHSNTCCANVLKYLKVTSMDEPYNPGIEGGTPPVDIPATSCCNKIEGELTNVNNPCGFVIKIERESTSGNWETLSTNVSITNGKFSFTDCQNKTKGRYRISLEPSSGVSCIFIREAKCKATCCLESSDIHIYDNMADEDECCFKMDITVPPLSCITNVTLQTGNQQALFQLSTGINTLSFCVPYPGSPLKFIFGKSSGMSECEAFVTIPCSNCCPKLGSIDSSNIVHVSTNAQECCYVINGTIDNSDSCYTAVSYQTYNKNNNTWTTVQAPINGNNYSAPICVKPTTETGKKYSISPILRLDITDNCKREFELPCLPDCCPRITITRVIDMTGNCCYTVEGVISGHLADPCFTSISGTTYIGNGQWAAWTLPINSNGTFALNICVPINMQNPTPVTIDFNTSFGTKCSQTLNLMCTNLDGGQH